MAITLLQRCFWAPDYRAVKKLHVGFSYCNIDTENFQNKEWEQQNYTFPTVHFHPCVTMVKKKKNPCKILKFMLAGSLAVSSSFASYASLHMLAKSLARKPRCLSGNDTGRNVVFGNAFPQSKHVETDFQWFQLSCCLLCSRGLAVDPDRRMVHSDCRALCLGFGTG